MVNTRKNQDQDDETEPLSKPSRARDRVENSEYDNDSDYEPLMNSSRPRWRKVLRSRYGSNFMTRERHSKHPRRLTIPRMRYVEDLMDDSDDLIYDDDEDERIFTPIRSTRKRSFRVKRSMAASPQNVNDESNMKEDVELNKKENITANRVQEEATNDDEEEEEEEGEEGDNDGFGVRRSKRQRKLTYDNFNQSWIIGTQTVLRGYPQMMPKRINENVDGTSNDEQNEIEEKGEEKPSTKNENEEGLDAEEDMYTKVKRTRRACMRYSPSGGEEAKARRGASRRARGNSRNGRRPRTRSPTPLTEDSTDEDGDDSSQPSRKRVPRRVYHLRENKRVVEPFQINEPLRKSSRLVFAVSRQYPRKRRNSSSSDEERFQRKKAKSLAKARSRCLPLNFKPSDGQGLQKTPLHSSKAAGGTLGPKGPADVDPMSIDTSVTFEKVGGLDDHLRCLKEMVVFPMLYREIFEKFHVQPPKGVLFHGPPGTGKTLIARALANECSHGSRKVSFFMRKGADCLSKWVGESERQLRLLFEQAYQMRPSIIFFDEIDGLAPVRSSKQDQIHASIVSTLLALLDGLDDRGDIIVIGATNRIDAIDPALRRPGRFDRELFFPLPGKKERIEILKIHTAQWANPPTQTLIEDLAERSVGYCGSDLRLLCSEAVVGALRRRYPQVYKSSKKLLLQTDQVQVQQEDFCRAYTKIVPASCRVNACPRQRLPYFLAPLLQKQLDSAIEKLSDIFPYCTLGSTSEIVRRSVYKPRFLLCGRGSNHGQTSYFAPALLEVMEHIPVHVISLDTILETSSRSSEEAIVQMMREATRNPPSILYMPGVDTWWHLLPLTFHRIFIDRLGRISPDAPVLLLATTNTPFAELSEELQGVVFKRDSSFELRRPNTDERKEFFSRLLLENAKKEPLPWGGGPVPEEEWEELPEAPPPAPPPPSHREIEELHNAEEHRLRELRIFLRDICGKLARNKQFFMFTKPVDINEVPDYLTIIQKPMDLETMMRNIDLHLYNCAQEFLCDIDLIVRNALEYNPERDPEDKLIRHRACALRDTAYTLIKAEMDTDFEEECRKISKKRKEEKEKKEEVAADETNESKPLDVVRSSAEPSHTNIVNGEATTLPLTNGPTVTTEKRKRSHSLSGGAGGGASGGGGGGGGGGKRRMRSTWARGMLKKRRAPGVSCGKKPEDESGDTRSGESTSLDTLNDDSAQMIMVLTPAAGDGEATKQVSSTSSIEGSASPKSVKPEQKCEATPTKKPRKSIKKLEITTNEGVTVDIIKLEELKVKFVAESETWNIEDLIDCQAIIQRIIEQFSNCWDRTNLPQALEDAFQKFAKSIKTDKSSF